MRSRARELTGLILVSIVLGAVAATTAQSAGGKSGAAAAVAQASPAKKPTRVDFLMPWVPPSEYAYWLVAQEKGFYAAEGLEVTLHEGTGSGNTVKLVGAGTMPLGLADASRILAGRAQGVPVTAVMTLFYTSPVSVVSLKGRGITRVEDLPGKTLGEAPESANLLAWRTAMARGGLDPLTVKLVALDPRTKGVALLRGQIDAILDQTLNADLAAEGVELDRFPLDLDVVADSVLVNDAFLQAQPEVVRGFLRASVKGAEHVRRNPTEAVDLLARRFPTVDRKKLQNRVLLEATWVWTKVTPVDRFGWQRIESWRQLQEILFDARQIDRKVELDAFVTNRYLPY